MSLLARLDSQGFQIRSIASATQELTGRIAGTRIAANAASADVLFRLGQKRARGHSGGGLRPQQ